MLDFKLKEKLTSSILGKFKVNDKSHIIEGFLG